MVTADWIAIAVAAAAIVLGALFGFGKSLKFFTSGIFGIIISVFICYTLGGLILDLKFVQELLNKFTGALTDKNGFCDFLLKIHIDIVVYYIVLFIVVQLARILIVTILKHIAESNNIVFKIINKVAGAAFMLVIIALISLFVFQVIYWIGGSTSAGFLAKLEGSFFKLDKLYVNNPLVSLPDRIKTVFASL